MFQLLFVVRTFNRWNCFIERIRDDIEVVADSKQPRSKKRVTFYTVSQVIDKRFIEIIPISTILVLILVTLNFIIAVLSFSPEDKLKSFPWSFAIADSNSNSWMISAFAERCVRTNRYFEQSLTTLPLRVASDRRKKNSPFQSTDHISAIEYRWASIQ